MEITKSKCRICGAIFEYTRTAKKRTLCSDDCKKLAHAMSSAERRGLFVDTKIQASNRKKAQKSIDAINKLNAEALASGMSYGKLVAMRNAPRFNRETRSWE